MFRLESIAVDAELQEKSLSELERLADILHESCAQAESEHTLRYIPYYSSKLSREKTFTNFVVFGPPAKVFSLESFPLYRSYNVYICSHY